MTQLAYKSWAAELGPEDPDTLSMGQNLVHALQDKGEFTKAIELQQDILERRRRILGPPDTLRSANYLTVALDSTGNIRDALSLYQDVHDRYCRALGDDHPDTRPRIRCDERS